MILLCAAAVAFGLFPQAGTSLADAMSLAKTHDQALYDAFNAGYRLTASGEVQSVEVITEFRRAVLLARERVERGDYSFTAQELAAAMAPFRGTVAFVVVARLNPLNTYARPPAYDMYVRTGPASAPLAAQNARRDPVYPPGLATPGTAMTGVRLEATFSHADIASAREPALVVNDDRGAELWQARIDLSRYR